MTMLPLEFYLIKFSVEESKHYFFKLSLLLSYVFMTGEEYERCVNFRNDTSVKLHQLEIWFVTTELENNFCTESEYDAVNECYQFTCVQKHVIFSILTLGK